MKKILTIIAITCITIKGMLLINGCAATSEIQAKSGAQLWGENCLRCHNAPSPADYSDAQWATIGNHMKVRASLTSDEITKVIEFLQSAN